jgi:hypothetical protein
MKPLPADAVFNMLLNSGAQVRLLMYQLILLKKSVSNIFRWRFAAAIACEDVFGRKPATRH